MTCALNSAFGRVLNLSTAVVSWLNRRYNAVMSADRRAVLSLLEGVSRRALLGPELMGEERSDMER